MADFPISSLPSGTLDSDSLLMVSTPDGLGGFDSEHVDAQQFAGIAVKHMEQTDYDNLSPAEKNNGTLYITDGTPPSETITGSDVLYFSDVSDSNKPKSTTAAALAGLALPISGLFKVVEFNSEANTVNAGATWYCSTSDTGYSVPTGYSLAATLSVRTNNDNFYIRYFHPSSYVVVKNTANSQQSVSVGITVLFVKTEYIT